MTDEIDYDEGNEWSDYDSGPFCPHWSDPSECDEKCSVCDHECKDHFGGDECRVEGCDCEGFTNSATT